MHTEASEWPLHQPLIRGLLADVIVGPCLGSAEGEAARETITPALGSAGGTATCHAGAGLFRIRT